MGHSKDLDFRGVVPHRSRFYSQYFGPYRVRITTLLGSLGIVACPTTIYVIFRRFSLSQHPLPIQSSVRTPVAYIEARLDTIYSTPLCLFSVYCGGSRTRQLPFRSNVANLRDSFSPAPNDHSYSIMSI